MSNDLTTTVDTWTYTINGVEVNTSTGYFNDARAELGFTYEQSSRIKWQPKNANHDSTFQGFQYDDLRVSSWISSNKSGTEDVWCADFS